MKSNKMKYGVILKTFVKTGKTLFGGKTPGHHINTIKLVNNYEDIKEGEFYIELKEKISDEPIVFTRKKCVFNYCPNPNLCDKKCINN